MYNVKLDAEISKYVENCHNLEYRYAIIYLILGGGAVKQAWLKKLKSLFSYFTNKNTVKSARVTYHIVRNIFLIFYYYCHTRWKL